MNAVAKVDQEGAEAAPAAASGRAGANAGRAAAGEAALRQQAAAAPAPDGVAAARAGRRRRLCLGHRRPLPGDRERQCPPVQGVDRLGNRRPHRRGRHRRERSRSRPATCCFAIDPEPYRIALAQADAALAAARLGVEQLRAAYSQAVAQERMAAGEVDYLQDAARPRRPSSPARASTRKSALDEATHDLAKAKDEQLAAAAGHRQRARRDRRRSRHRDRQASRRCWRRWPRATRRPAILAQTTVRAPADGVISQSTAFKVGQYVTAGTPLFSLVENGDTWVEANFKETQLTHMKRRPEGRDRARHLSRPSVQGDRRQHRRRHRAPSSRCCRRRTPPATG